ncbi:unnamed protein product, partial [Tetraodon nigroviridis]
VTLRLPGFSHPLISRYHGDKVVTCGLSSEQELVRLLQQTLRTSQCSRQPVAETPASADQAQGAEARRNRPGVWRRCFRSETSRCQALSGQHANVSAFGEGTALQQGAERA